MFLYSPFSLIATDVIVIFSYTVIKLGLLIQNKIYKVFYF